jgi:hypothetical protein
MRLMKAFHGHGILRCVWTKVHNWFPKEEENARKIIVIWLVLEQIYFVGEMGLCMLEVVG